MNKTMFNNRIECNSFLQMLYNINGKDRVKVCCFTEHTDGTIELCYSILPLSYNTFANIYNDLFDN